MRSVWLALVVASLGWGTSGVATRATLDQGLDPYAIAVIRSAMAALLVVLFLALRGQGLPRGRAAWSVGVVMGVTNLAAPIVLSNIALQYASAGFIGVTTALIPLITAVIAHSFLPERLTIIKVFGLVVGFGGVAVLLLSGDSGLAEGGRPLVAGALALVAVASIAVGGVYAKRHSGDYDLLEVTGVHFVSGLALVAAAALAVEGLPGVPTAAAWGLLGYMAAGSTFIPFILYYWMIRRVSATFASTAGYLVPLLAVFAGMALLDERLQGGIVAGGLLILIGVVVTDRAERPSY